MSDRASIYKKLALGLTLVFKSINSLFNKEVVDFMQLGSLVYFWLVAVLTFMAFVFWGEESISPRYLIVFSISIFFIALALGVIRFILQHAESEKLPLLHRFLYLFLLAFIVLFVVLILLGIGTISIFIRISAIIVLLSTVFSLVLLIRQLFKRYRKLIGYLKDKKLSKVLILVDIQDKENKSLKLLYFFLMLHRIKLVVINGYNNQNINNFDIPAIICTSTTNISWIKSNIALLSRKNYTEVIILIYSKSPCEIDNNIQHMIELKEFNVASF